MTSYTDKTKISDKTKMTEEPFSEHRMEAAEQLEESQELYPTMGDTNPTDVSEFNRQYEDSENIDDENLWTLSGRIVRENEFGDFVFYDINDSTGTVQVMCSVDERTEFRTEDYNDLQHVNIGDRVVFEGKAGRSDTGELTLRAESYVISSNALQDMSGERNELGDEMQITHRTRALISNNDLHDTVRTRFEIQSGVRSFLSSQDYIEVETPILQQNPGGAEATPFATHCEALDRDVYLRIAPELYLKRLITSGFGQVFEMSRCFRNEDIDTTHNPEFTLLELYREYADYTDMMELTENVYAYVAEEVTGETTIEYGGEEVDLSPSWERISFDSAIEDVFSQRVESLTEDQVRNYLVSRHGYDSDDIIDSSTDELLMEVFDVAVEPSLVQPTFVTDYPKVSTPLCMTTENSDKRVERFEAFICGMEVANSYTELTDPRLQRERLIEQAGGEDNIDEEFVTALSYGMPPTAGLGLGIDRMCMLLTDTQSIKDVIPYPMSSTRI